MGINDNILDCIGNTPVVKLSHMDTGNCELFLKLENQNPSGSIKDRIALSMIAAAERKGLIRPGDEIIEATAGNTGLGLALVSTIRKYRLTLVIPDKMSSEKIRRLSSMGVNIVITRSDVEKGHPEYYQDLALSLSKKRSAYYIDQFNNPANPEAHMTTTGPEIWEQTGHNLDAIVVGVGSSGTMTGLTAFFKKVKPDMELILADPKGSILAGYAATGKITGPAGSWLVEGIGEDFVPAIADFSMVKKAYSISDGESFMTARNLLVKEGIFAGSSSGTLLAAALAFSREQKTPKRILTFVCDSGSNYLTKMYNEIWMKEHGLLQREKFGDLRDLVFRRYDQQEVMIAAPTDSLRQSYIKMKENSISQLPVMERDEVVGFLAESDLLFALAGGGDTFATKVEDVMSRNVISLGADAREMDLLDILKNDYVAIVKDRNGRFFGIITKIDYLNFLEMKTIH